ncbi:hypothetical protein LTR36_007677 [Oleoguttula mirabilis]|uniref:FAD-binding domain-containing protein n=1 Tax=Oleoguttula mirabilis TaxID=1507867 RepID=A0AAV9JUK2_9PEZI|nr:hypothetical protein LTR36_007677 [Oleoguttula mirabilis]
MSNLRVLIAGASVAGPAAAYWFARAGAHVTVIERFPHLRRGGQNIDIRNVGVTVMRKTPGMEAAVRAKKAVEEGICIVDAEGRPFATMRATGNPEQQSLVSEYEIMRGDLAHILYDMTKENERVKYVFGEQIASTQQNESEDEPITVEFANGLPTAEYDLVVACDGSTSRTRAIGLGCGVRDHITPTNCWAAFFSVQADLVNGSKMGHGFSATGGRLIAVGPDEVAGVNRATFLKFYPRDGRDATLPFREASKQGTDALRRYVAQEFSGAGWKTDDIIKAMLETDDFYASEAVQVKVPSLHKGRFVLVGDAGFAPGLTGTGTTLALVGAYLLAGEVGCRHKGDLAAGLAGYEERMRPILKDLQKPPGVLLSIIAPQTAWGIRLRNWLLVVIFWVMDSRISGMFGWVGRLLGSAFSSDTYGLPDYEWVA